MENVVKLVVRVLIAQLYIGSGIDKIFNPEVTVPLVPKFLFFLSLMFIIPALPAASYFDDGCVMISIASISLA